MKKKTEIIVPENLPAPAQLFARARDLNNAAQLHGSLSVAAMVMCGVELCRIKQEMGITHGTRTDLFQAGTSWEDLCLTHAGVSKTAAWRYTQLAIACGKKVRGLEALMTEDPNTFDQAKRDRLTKAVAKAIDGHTATEILREWGVAKLDPTAESLKAREAARLAEEHKDITNPDGTIDDAKLEQKDREGLARSYWTETCKTLLVQGKNNKSWRLLNDAELDAIRRTLTAVLKELT